MKAGRVTGFLRQSVGLCLPHKQRFECTEQLFGLMPLECLSALGAACRHWRLEDGVTIAGKTSAADAALMRPLFLAGHRRSEPILVELPHMIVLVVWHDHLLV